MAREIKFKGYGPKGMTKAFTLFELSGFITALVQFRPEGGEEEWVWLQYTGLKDGKDVEIYEGDIAEMKVINEFGSYQIKRGVMMMHPEGFWGFKFDVGLDLSKTSPPVVIGNFYQHPELLK